MALNMAEDAIRTLKKDGMQLDLEQRFFFLNKKGFRNADAITESSYLLFLNKKEIELKKLEIIKNIAIGHLNMGFAYRNQKKKATALNSFGQAKFILVSYGKSVIFFFDWKGVGRVYELRKYFKSDRDAYQEISPDSRVL